TRASAGPPRGEAAQQQPHGIVDSTPSPDLVNAAFCTSLSAGFLPISPLLLVRFVAAHSTRQQHEPFTACCSASRLKRPSNREPERSKDCQGTTSRDVQRLKGPKPPSWYGGREQEPIMARGEAHGHAFEDQARGATAPTSRASATGGGAQDDPAARPRESFRPISTRGLAAGDDA